MLKTTILIDNLKNGISFSHHAISSRSPLPILLNFLIEAKNGELKISATDLEIGIEFKMPAKVESEGSVTVPAKTFLDLINSIDEKKVLLEENEKVLVLSGEKLKTQFPIISASEFPKLYEEKGEKKAEFKKSDFDKLVSRIVFAAAQDTTRPALSGLLIEPEDGGINLVATDGYRLSLKKDASAKIFTKEESSKLIVSARLIKEIMNSKGDSLNISMFTSPTSNQVLFELSESIIVGRLIEAEYPEYQKIIPQESNTKIEFDRQDALNAVKSCSVFAREAANIIKIAITRDKLIFSASASGAGENEVEVEAKVTGEENEIAFNARYLLDFLTNIDDEKITFEMTGPLNPGVFKIAGDNTFLHLIMPIRIQG